MNRKITDYRPDGTTSAVPGPHPGDVSRHCPNCEALARRVDQFWFMVENEWDVEPRSFFEAEAPKTGDWSPEGMAVHYVWKREPKVEALARRVEELEANDVPWSGEAKAEKAIRYLEGDNREMRERLERAQFQWESDQCGLREASSNATMQYAYISELAGAREAVEAMRELERMIINEANISYEEGFVSGCDPRWTIKLPLRPEVYGPTLALAIQMAKVGERT